MTDQEIKLAVDVIAKGGLAPEKYLRKPKNILIALEMANRWGLDPFMTKATETVKVNITFPSGTWYPETDTYHTENATMTTDESAFCHGYLAKAQSLGLGSNPYTPMTAESISWAQGWIDADHDTEDQ